MLMTDTVMISMIGAVATVALATVNGVFAVIGNARSKRNEEHLVETKNAVKQVQEQTDGMSSALAKVTGEKEYARAQQESVALLKVTAEAEHAKGVQEGTDAAAACAYKGPDSICKFPGTAEQK